MNIAAPLTLERPDAIHADLHARSGDRYGETALDLMRQIKAALDPNQLLNPDKIFES